MTEDEDVTHLWQCLHAEVQASKDALMPQIGWLHWDMATKYAERLARRTGTEIHPIHKRKHRAALTIEAR